MSWEIINSKVKNVGGQWRSCSVSQRPLGKLVHVEATCQQRWKEQQQALAVHSLSAFAHVCGRHISLLETSRAFDIGDLNSDLSGAFTPRDCLDE